VNVGLDKPRLKTEQFDYIKQLLYRVSRIDLRSGKESLVEARLSRRLRQLGLGDYAAYIRHLEGDHSGGERAFLVDALTTNKTSFFREDQHFEFLRQQLVPQWRAEKRNLRLWCAGCSSGQESYTIVMVLREAWPELDEVDACILATDLSASALATARGGVYRDDALAEVPSALRQKYFLRTTQGWEATAALRAPITYAGLNLMESWPMRGPFDAIFCRNVMIYFDQPTQEELVRRYYGMLRPGGHFFISHSESLSGMDHDFTYVQPAVYVR